MSGFSFQCERCRKIHPVSMAQAGTVLRCSCGADMSLPPLSQLRQQAGMAAYEKPTSAIIMEMVQSGQLPEGTACIQCGVTCNPKSLIAICERTRMRTHSADGGSGGGLFLTGMIGGIPFLLPLGGGGSEDRVTEEQLGRTVVVPVPLRICAGCWNDVSGCNLNGLLQKCTPILGIAALLLLVLWFIGPLLRFDLPVLWAVACFGVAVACGIARRWHSSRATHAVKSLLRKTPIYGDLCDEYPEAEVVAGQLDEYTDPVQ